MFCSNLTKVDGLKYILMSLLCVLLCSGNLSAQNDFNLQFLLPDDDFSRLAVCGQAQTHTLRLENISGEVLTDVQLKFDFPNGIFFVAGSLSGAGTEVSSMPPILSFDEFQINESVVIEYQLDVNCDGLALALSSSSTNYQVDLCYVGGNSEQINNPTPNFEVVNATLSIPNVVGNNSSNNIFDAAFNLVDTVKTTIVNGSAGALESLTYCVDNTHPSLNLKEIRIAGMVVPLSFSSVTGDSLYFELGATHIAEASTFAGNEVQDPSLFQFNESLTVCEVWEVVDCPEPDMVIPDISRTAYYGCDGTEICQSTPTSFTGVRFGVLAPAIRAAEYYHHTHFHIDYKDRPYYSDCYSDKDERFTYSFMVTNNGDANLKLQDFNILTHAHNYYYIPFALDETSVVSFFQDGNTQTPMEAMTPTNIIELQDRLSPTHGYITNCHDGDGSAAWELEFKDQDIIIPPGDTLMIQFDAYHDEEDCGTCSDAYSQFNLPYPQLRNIVYNDECEYFDFNELNSSVAPRMRQYIRSFTEGNNNFFPGAINCTNWFVTAGENYFINYYCPNNGQPQVGSSYDDNRYHINSENAWLEDWYILPEGLDWTGVDGDLNTTELTWIDATGTKYPVYDLEYTDHNSGPDTLKVRYQGSGAECFDLRQSTFSLKTIPDCSEGPSFCSKTVAIVKESFYVTECDMDGQQCFEEIDVPRPFNATIQSCACNPCEGMVFTYLDLSRQTFGENDPDNDGIVEAGMLDQNKINKIRFIAGDTIRATYGGWVNLITKPDFEYAYATIDVPVIGSGSTALGDEGITPLGAMVEIWDASTGDMYSCDLVQLFPDGQKVVANLSVQSLKDLNCAGMPTDFTYGQDDSISVKFDFRLKDYRSVQTNVNFGSSYYMTDMEYDIGTHYQCNSLSQSMTYIEYRAYNEWIYREVGGCNDAMDNNYNGSSYGSIASIYDSHRNLFRLGSTGFDYFPFEVREIARITQQTYVNNSDLNWGDEFKILVYDNNGHLTETGGSLSWQRYTLNMNTSSCFAINGNTLVVDFECIYEEVGYERFDEGMDIYCAPEMSPTCQSEYEPPYSLKDVDVYTDYDMLESMFCSPTWTAIDTSIGVNDGIVDPFNNSIDPPFMHYATSIYSADYFRLVSLPKVQLQPHTVNQLLLEEEACFKVDVSNIGSGPAENVFFTFENQSGAIVFQGVNDGVTGDPLDDNLGVINLGSLAVGETRELEFCVTSNNCNRDSILINTGWDCNGLPSTPAEAACTDPVTLYLDIPDAALSMVVTSPDPSAIHVVDLCEEVEYEVQISSSDLAAIHDINFQMNLPPGTDFVDGSFQLAYPINAGVDTMWVTTANQPVSSGGSTYHIVLDGENALLEANGLEGTTDLSKNFLLVKFRTYMGCGALSNARMRFLSWAYDPCDEFVNYKFSPGPIVKINGVSDSYVSNLSVPEAEQLNACEGNTIEVGVNFTLALTSLPTGDSDSIMVELPAGIIYVPNSYMVVSNGAPPSPTNPLIVSTSDGEIVYIDLKDNVMAGETVDVTFEISAEDVAQACRDYDLIVRTFNSQKVYCEASDELCDVRTTSDEVTGSVSIVKPDIYISNVELSAEAAPTDQEIVSYCMDLSNEGEAIEAGTTTTVELYDDSNDNGDYDAGVDVYLASITTMEAIAAGGTLEVCGTVNVPSGMTCNVLAIINPETTCACNTNKSYRTNAELSQQFPETAYEVCSDGAITNIGPEPLDNVTYEWVGIDGASLVGFSSTTSTPVDFQFRNTTGNTLDWKYYLRSTRNDDCATLDTICITVFPEEHGTVSLQACPFDEFNLSGPTGKTNYQWTPSLGLDDPNAANTNAEASYYPEGVHDFVLSYTDENGCPGDFTVEVTIVPCALTYVGNYVWCDDNNNGIQDDAPIEGMTVELFGSTDPTTPIASTMTDADGAFLFGPIPQGEYLLGLDLDGSNYLTAMKNATTSDLDSDLNPNFQTDPFYLSNGDSLTTIDLGILCPEVDISLEKTALTDKDAGLLEAVVIGDTMFWNIEVCNRTLMPDSVNFDADSIVVTELLTPGIAYLSHTTTSGTYDPMTGLWELDRLANGSCRSLCIMTLIDEDILPITNTAEITSAKDPDIDSTPDNDDGDQSEDDEDFATIYPKRMDLALTKKVADSQSLPVEAGNSVQFTIEVCNQGNVPAYEVQLVDYIPTGMSLDDANWIAGTGNEVFYSFTDPIALNDCESMDITLKIDDNFAGDTLTNFAEIAYQAYDDGIYAPDIDSETDDISGNDGPVIDDAINNEGGDQDDHDAAGIHLVMVECMASNDGPVCPGTSVNLNETGGNAVAWSWSGPGGFSSNVQNPVVNPAIAGTYTVMVTDENGFEETCTTEVILWEGMALNANQSHVSCQGGNDGSIDLMVTGGAAPYTYDWSNDGPENPDNDNQDINSLTAGNYTVTVTDANGCIASLSSSITEPTLVSCTASATDALCNGSETGSIVALGSGGTAPYEFSLNGGTWQPSGAFSDLAAGNYNIAVRDANLCVSVCNTVVNEPALLTCSLTGTDLSDCEVVDGMIATEASGGTAPYMYSIDGGSFGSSSSFSGLMAGSHTVTIKDDNDCTTTCEVTLTAPSAPMCTIAATVDIACFGDETGSISVTGSGGDTPYEFSIDNVDYQSSGNFNNLEAGDYNVYIRNADSPMCVSMCSTTLSEPTDLTCDHVTTDVSCFGGDDGSVIIDANGGVTPYEYSLGGPWQPGINFTGLEAGVYTATVRDANGCTTTCMVSIMEPSVLTCSVSSTDALCFGSETGTIAITGNGGVPAYEYSLNNGPWQTSPNFENLEAGNYNVAIRDSQDCVSSCTATINEPTTLSCTLAKEDLSDCNVQDGEITVMPLGGTAPYTYSIDGGSFGSNAVFTGLIAGTHIVITRDNNGCETSCEITLTAPTMPECTISSFTNILCFGESTGSISVDVMGGNMPYEYSLDNMTYQSSNTFNNLAAGVHTIYVRNVDSPMCLSMCSYELTEPTVLVYTSNQTNVLCKDGNNGSIDLMVSGGTAPYSYDWSNDGAENPDNDNQDLNGLTAGEYSVTISDANGCTAILSTTITEPTQLVCTASSTDVLCNGTATGTISVSANGGVGPYEFSLNSGAWQTSNAFNDLEEGTYNITVRDVNLCTSTCMVTIDEPAALSCNLTGTDLTDCSVTDGMISTTANGGTAPYTYSINGGTFVSNGSFTNLMAGNHIVTVKDANDCTSTCAVTLTAPSAPMCTIASTVDIACFEESTGVINVSGSGGETPYEYSIDNVSYQLSNSFTGLSEGSYTVYIRNVNSPMCVSMCATTLTQPTNLVCDQVITNVSCFGGSDGSVIIDADGGVTPYEYSLGGPWQPGISFDNLEAGEYTATVRDINGCTTTCVFEVTEPSLLTCSLSATDALCKDSATGSITVTASGGVPMYEYSLNNGPWQTDNNFDNLPAGNHEVTIRDNQACLSTCSISINEPAALSCTLSKEDVSDCDVQDGKITVNPVGGTAPYVFSINNGTFSANAEFTGLGIGNHIVTTIDDNGCETTCEISLTAPMMPTCAISAFTDILCYGEATGSLSVEASGGNAPYEYSLDDITYQSSNTFNNLAAGVHTIYVRNVNSTMCISMCAYELTEPTLLVCDHTQEDVSCKDGDDGSILINADGGVTPYEYSIGGPWQPGALFEGLEAGEYTVSVRDAHNCISECMVTIGEPSILECQFTKVDAACFETATGSIIASGTGGTGSYEYNLDNGPWQIDQQFTMLAAGNYTLTVRDENECISTCEISIGEPALLTCELEGTDLSDCIVQDGEIEVTAAGGTEPYTYSIDGVNFVSTNVFTGLMAGTHMITSMDAQGCEASCEVILSAPAAPMCAIEETINIACKDDATGEITVSATGGEAPYEYSLDNNSYQSSATFSDLIAGNYTIYVRNVNSPMCITMCTAELTEPLELICDTEHVDVLCKDGDDGSVNIDATGGVTPYEYMLDGVWQDSPSFEDLSAGNYTATVRDDNDCTVTCSFTISEPTQLSCSLDHTDVVCNGDGSGSITTNPTGGIAPYEFSLNGGSWQSGPLFTEVPGGSHIVSVRDAHGCITTCEVEVFEPEALVCQLEYVLPESCAFNDGEISVIPIGGVLPHTFSIDGDNFQNEMIFSGLSHGEYTITIKDGNGCLSTCEVSVDPDCFDLAIEKQLVTDAPYSYGQKVVFEIEITNEGNIDASNIELTEFIPCGFTYEPTSLINLANNWTPLVTSFPMTTIPTLAENESTTRSIELTVEMCADDGAYINIAEISEAYDANGNAIDDADSTPDFDPTNDPETEDDHDTALLPIYDPSLIKTISTTDFTYGDDLTFVIQVCNQIGNPIGQVQVVDYMPEAYSFDMSKNPGWSPGVANQLNYTHSSSVIGGNDCIDIPLVLTLEMGDDYDDWYNVAEIVSFTDELGTPQEDTDATNDNNPTNDGPMEDNLTDNLNDDEDDSDYENIEIIDAALIKYTEDEGPFVFGDTVSYDFVVFNQGNIDLYNININDYLPCGYKFLASNSPTWSITDTVANTTFAGPLTPGTSDTISIELEIVACTSADAWQNVAEIVGLENENEEDITDQDIDSEYDIDPHNDPYTDDITDNADGDEDDHDAAFVDIFDLALEKRVTPFVRCYYGDTVTFNITVYNQGNVEADNITVLDSLPEGYLFLPAINPDWDGSANPVLAYNIPTSLAPGDSITFPIRAEIIQTDGGEDIYTNIAEIENSTDISGGAWVDADSFQDHNFSNDRTGETVGSTEDDHDIERIDVVDLALLKTTENNGPYSYGDTIVFDIELFNEGNEDLYDIQFFDSLPCGFTYLDINDGFWTYHSADHKATASVAGPLEPGESMSVEIALALTYCEEEGAYTNIARLESMSDEEGNDITHDDKDVDDEDFMDEETIEIFDLALIKEIITPEPFEFGDKVSFKITTLNQGNVPATNITLTDYVPVGYGFDATDNPGWDDSDAPLYTRLITDTLAQGEFHCDTIELTIMNSTGGLIAYTNMAEISEAQDTLNMIRLDVDSTPDQIADNDGEPIDDETDDPADEDDHDIASIPVFDLAFIKKAASLGPHMFGDTVAFDFILFNQGNMAATDVSMIDYSPCGFEFDSSLNPAWTEDSNGNHTSVYGEHLLPGMTDTLVVYYIIKACDTPATAYLNTGEIVQAYDTSGNDMSSQDQDSNYDSTFGNDGSVSDNEIAGIDGDEDDSDIENIAVPAISLDKFLVDIQPSAGMVDHIDVTFELLFKNVGNEDLTDIELIDELDDPLNFGPSYVGIAVGGDPVILYTTAAVDPTINIGFDGMAAGDPNLFDGTPSLLEPCDSIRVSFTAQLDASLAVDPEMLFNRASVTGQFELADMTTGEVEEEAEVQVLPCISNCEIACEASINVSLNEDCIAVITPAMGGAGIEDYCNYYYDIELFDPWSNPMPNDTVGMDLLGYCITYTITEPECGNTCSGEACIEYYLPPTLTCPSDTIVSCGALASIDESVLITEFCVPGMVILTNEVPEAMDCDDPYSTVITRTYVAQDEMGNTSAPCTFSISLERPDISTIMCPDNLTVGTANALDCAHSIPLDAQGYPVPYDEETGLGTGVPFILDSEGMPVYLYPDVADQYCDLLISYEDMEVPGPNCSTKIMRTWTIIEWDCDGDNEETCTQMIDITDTTGPELTCPDDVTVSTTTADCRAEISLPMANAVDACNDIHSYLINYGSGTLNTNGGDIVLPTGNHSVIYSVFDVCGNLSQCEMMIDVEDNIEPTPICEQSIAVSLNNLGYGIAYANSLDQGSFDDCGVSSVLVSRMTDVCDIPDNLTFRPFVEFCCADFETEVMVRLQVTDMSGNTNECMVMVEIQDKVTPTMVCLPDTTVECTAIFDIDDLAATFGYPSMSDNCMNEGDLEESINDQRSECGIGIIERTIDLMDNGQVAQTCVQIIEVINSDAFGLASITWPADFESTDVCGLDDLSPDALDPPYNRPVFDEGPCELVGHEYVDQVFEFVEGETACLKVLRTWTLVDWCQQVDGAYLRWEHEQVLKINNTIDPTILSTCVDIIVETADVDCASGDVNLELLVEDDCTTEENLIVQFDIDIDTDGSIDTSGLAIEASDEYPVGTHQIYWTVQDGCGNETTCDYSFQVLSTKTPIPVCEIDQPVFLMPVDNDGDGEFDDEEVTITAEDFDGGSFHPCGYDIDFSFSEDVNFTLITLYCNDLGAFPIELWVTDEEGNQAFCETTIQVVDNNDEDICPEMNMVAVRGNIATETNVDLSHIEVYLEGDTLMNLTDEAGDYRFENMPTGGSYKVKPTYDYDPLNGVSTLDIVIIQRHILGINDLDSPYQLIAADADNSESITAADLLDIRRLILGINERFTNNTSWRFVDALNQFIEPSNPWSSGFDEDYLIGSLNENMWIDFVGVKVGDVNGSVENTIIDHTDNRSNEMIDVEYVISGNELQLIATENMDLYGLQMHITDVTSLLDIESDLMDLDMQNVHNAYGNLVLSYAPKSIQEVQAGENFMSFIFQDELKDVKLGDLLNTECYLGNDLTTKRIRLKEFVAEQSIVKAYPNPWIQTTTIEFESDIKDTYVLRLFNNLGQLEFSTKIHAEIGINKVLLKKEYFKESGIKHYTLQSKGRKMHTGKMFLLE